MLSIDSFSSTNVNSHTHAYRLRHTHTHAYNLTHTQQCRCEDDLTHKLAEIIRANNALRKQEQNGAPQHIISDFVSLVQVRVHFYLCVCVCAHVRAWVCVLTCMYACVYVFV